MSQKNMCQVMTPGVREGLPTPFPPQKSSAQLQPKKGETQTHAPVTSQNTDSENCGPAPREMK